MFKININEINKKIRQYTYMKESMERHMEILEGDSIEIIIFKLYLTLESLEKISRWLDSKGYRLKSQMGNRKYRVQDISKIIKEAEGIDPELLFIVRRIYELNKKGIKEKEWSEHGICLSNNG